MLIFAPTGRDAALTASMLARMNLHATICDSIDDVCERIENEGAAAVLLAEEVLGRRAVDRLAGTLARQEPWSDLPLIVFTSPEGSIKAESRRIVERLGNVALLDRPVRPITMLSAARAAVRARRRQYEARAALIAQQHAVQRRDEFLAMLGHELRNPLSAVHLAIEGLQREGADLTRYQMILRRQAETLSRLVDDLLDVSRVTSGKIALQRELVDLRDIVGRCVLALDATIRAQGLAVACALSPQPAVVHGDPVRLEQVVVNLVTNAIKYTPAGGHIEITVETDEVQRRARLRIRDDGVGIEREMLGRIFDLFAQVERTLDRSKGGLGIGLTLARSLVHLHQGTIEAASAGLGQGSEFAVELPLVDPATARRATDDAASSGSARYSVLLVEDNQDTRETLADLLEEVGHRVDAIDDGLTAVDRERMTRPDVMIVDIGLPGIDGYEVARRVRARRGDSVYLIAITGYGQPEDRRRALDAGFDTHYTKPVDVGTLVRLLERPDLVPRALARGAAR